MKEEARAAKYAIVYLAYGLESGKFQAVISIYSLFHSIGIDRDDILVIIYTDGNHKIFDSYLHGLPVKLEILTKEQVRLYKGQNNFIFRLKTCILEQYFAKYQYTLLYMDTDTFFLRDPTILLESIKPGHTLMNVEEYNFVDGGVVEPVHWYILRQGLKKFNYNVQAPKQAIPLSTMMWNAGVIGMSKDNAELLPQIINLTDELYEQSPTFIVEQFATSYILQNATQLRSTEDYIEHYWPKNIKQAFNLRIPGFLKENAGKSGKELYALAFDFAQKVRQISTPYQEPLTIRLSTRLKLIMQVARRGYL